ncbi:hypothetical protein [Stackebrandtia soli]|uniref:hypothetical protein n=1 Tax=Stackebrandtia soli TaxID=1892856 RepID=UPI0039EB7E0A
MTEQDTPPPLASVDALETLLGEPLTGRGRDRAAAVLDGVSAEVRAVAGRAWITDPPPLAVSIVLRATERAIRNPQQLTTERVGDYSRGFDTGTVPAGVWLTDGETAAIARLVDVGGIVSVATVRDVDVSDHEWS